MKIVKWGIILIAAILLFKVAWFVGLEGFYGKWIESTHRTPEQAKDELISRAGDSISTQEIGNLRGKKIRNYNDLGQVEGAVRRLNQVEQWQQNLRNGNNGGGSGSGNQQHSQAGNSPLVSQVPPTPAAVDCRNMGSHVRCEWPTQSVGWVNIGPIPAGMTISADSNGRITDRWWPKYGIMGAAGLDYTCSPDAFCSELPAPKLPSYAVLAKLGENGEAVVLTGRYGHPLYTDRDANLYVKINDFAPASGQSGVTGVEGSVPINIKK